MHKLTTVQKLNSVKNLSLEDVDALSMNIARELLADGFDLEALADIEAHIMGLARERVTQLGGELSNREDAMHAIALMIEIAIYIGIDSSKS